MKKYLSRLLAAFLSLVLLVAPASALTVEQALELLEDNYYYDIPDSAYQADSLDQLFELLGDPYTEYMTAEEYQAFLDLVENTVDIVGIGVTVQYTDQGMLVDGLVDGGSAQAAGLQPGDLIVAVDGVSCVPADSSHRDLILGTEGSQVTVTVLRQGASLSYTLTRRAVVVPNTQFKVLEGGVGYIDCNSFGSDTAQLLGQGLRQYDSQVRCWLMDLRSNTGGYTTSALEMLGQLNGSGNYLYFEDHDGGLLPLPSLAAPLTNKPLLLLVNGGSASASELLAAGVRDTERGVLVGQRTYGKGVAQTMLDEGTDPDYFDGDGMKITIARFYAAGGCTTDRIGVIPTLPVDPGREEAVALALLGGSEAVSTLCVMPAGVPLYVDPQADSETVADILSALSPQIPVFAGSDLTPCTPAQAAAALGVEYQDRWFTDLEGSAYAAEINAMGTYDLLRGTDPGVFSPKETLTRAQLCVMLARVLNVTAVGPSRFSDVAQDAWYCGEVNAMAELGLVNGVGDGKFDPEGTLTLEEFLTIMGRTARYLNFALDLYGQLFEDPETELTDYARLTLAPWSEWARSSVAVLAWGVDDRRDMLYAPLEELDPSAPVLREEAAAGMYQVLSVLEILP